MSKPLTRRSLNDKFYYKPRYTSTLDFRTQTLDEALVLNKLTKRQQAIKLRVEARGFEVAFANKDSVGVVYNPKER